MIDSTLVEIRVRYPECDAQSVAHHSVYPVWMEIARVELLRVNGLVYRECERRGLFFVVTQLNLRYRRPAFYDDMITVRVRHTEIGRIRIDHEYTIMRGDEVLAEATSTLACVDRQGKPQAIPDWFLTGPASAPPE